MRRSTARLAVLAVTAGVALTASGGTPIWAAPATAATATAATATVTLITGDRVRVEGNRVATVERGRASIGGFRQEMVGSHLYVIPDEALPLLAANRLDRRLFDVTGLIDQGYSDASTATVPVIADRPQAANALAGVRKVRDLPSIGATALTVGKRDAATFWSDFARRPTAKLWLDGKARASLADSTAQIGAPEAWARGLTGDGATVAVLDTGADTTHPDLADRVKEAVSFVPGEDAGDRNGHGTHTASTVGGSGAASDGQEKGVAPGATLLVGKVLGDDGYGQDSWIIAGMEWAAAHADVVSMSLGSAEPSDGTDPMAEAVNRLSADTGALFVVAAGNSYAEQTIGSPGSADAALTVAAVDGQDQRADFSSQGPRSGDAALKPDIAAPGVGILAARSQATPGEGWYIPMDGTSMATPHVAGAAAILAAAHPAWRGDQIKDALMSSAKALPETTPFQVGTGRLDVPAALGTLHATGSAYLGFFDWPHDGDDPVSKPITYANDGGTAVTLHLQAQAPAQLSSPILIVPAQGTASVTVTADPDDIDGAGRFTGFVTATDDAGAVRARTAIGLVKEDERYNLRVTAKDRKGKAAGGFLTLYRYGDEFARTVAIDPATGESAALRLPPGDYDATSWLPVDDGAGVALLGTPHLVLDRNRTLALDARAANPITVRTPRPSEDAYRRVQYFRDSGIGGIYATFLNAYTVPSDVDRLYAAPTATIPGTYELLSRWSRPTPALEIGGLDPLYLTGSPKLDGKFALRGIYAGDGASYPADAAGKVAVVRWSASVTADQRAAAATAARVALLVVVNDGPGRRAEWAGPVPSVSVSATQGRGLIAAARTGRLTLRGIGHAAPAYAYELVSSWPGRVPTRLSYTPTRLAQVDQRFVRTGAATTGYDLRADCRSYQWPPCLGIPQEQPLGTARTDYYSTQDSTAWYQGAFLPEGPEQRHDQVTYRPGARSERVWFGPVTHPKLGPGYWGPNRQGDFMAVSVPEAGGPADITGSMNGSGTVTSRLYQNGTLVGREVPDFAIQTEVPHVDGPAVYRFEQDTSRDETWGTSIRTRTQWTFRSSDTDEQLSLQQLGFAVATDLTGALPAWRPQTIGVAAPGGRVVSFQISYDDGASWQSAPLAAGRALLSPHRPGWVSLRATATNASGGQVVQEVIRAYRLR
ncbi:S8 family serine peptidase [Actinoplanes sp. CA-142083]|uniref:S8 family serine peptidase n=1 Tax=Actinoplanes sp. CA-142083 TaxID=3239903 RepID=UPI003D8D4A31